MKNIFIGAMYTLACFLFNWMLFSIWFPLPFIVLALIFVAAYVYFIKGLVAAIHRGETPNVNLFS